MDVAELADRFPLTFAEAGAGDQDEKFGHAVRLLCMAIQAVIAD